MDFICFNLWLLPFVLSLGITEQYLLPFPFHQGNFHTLIFKHIDKVGNFLPVNKFCVFHHKWTIMSPVIFAGIINQYSFPVFAIGPLLHALYFSCAFLWTFLFELWEFCLLWSRRYYKSYIYAHYTYTDIWIKPSSFFPCKSTGTE